jgi:uncharacterized protein YndB with AHSA1/START domain
MKINRSIVIKADPEKIWPFLVEPERILQWCFTLQNFEYTNQVSHGVGSSFTYREQGRFRSIELNCIIKEWIENKKITFEMTGGKGFKGYKETWMIEPISDGSKFYFINQSHLRFGIFGKILEPITRRRAEITVDEMLAKLKRLVEEDRGENSISDVGV